MSEDLIKTIISSAEDKKASDIEVMNTQAFPAVADFFIICSVNNKPQMRAVCSEIISSVKKKKKVTGKVSGNDGQTNWTVIDFGDVIVHIMEPKVREFYRLEDLWKDSEVVFYE